MLTCISAKVQTRKCICVHVVSVLLFMLYWYVCTGVCCTCMSTHFCIVLICLHMSVLYLHFCTFLFCTYMSTHFCIGSVVCVFLTIVCVFVCAIHPTQSVMHVPLQVNRFAESILLIVQYRYLKSCSGDFYSPESAPPHKIMRYWFYYSIWLGFSFSPDRICQVEMICIGGVPVSKRHFGGAGS